MCLCCPIMKKKIITCFHVCHDWQNNIDSKKIVESGKAFLIKPKHQCHLSNEENVFMVPNHEKKGIITASMFVTTDRIMLIPKIEGKKSFSHQAKVSMPSIPMRRMCLRHPFLRKKRLICAFMFFMING